MTVTYVDILHNERAGQRSLGLDRATRDALAEYSRTLWPTNSAKNAAREWDLSLDEARGVVAGRASQATIDKIFKHPNGGWRIVLPVLGAVIGHGVDSFFREQMRHAAREAERAREHEQLAQAAYRRLAPLPADAGEDGRTRGGSGEVGAQAPRRVGGSR